MSIHLRQYELHENSSTMSYTIFYIVVVASSFHQLQRHHDPTFTTSWVLNLHTVLRISVDVNIVGKTSIYPIATMTVPPNHWLVNTNCWPWRKSIWLMSVETINKVFNQKPPILYICNYLFSMLWIMAPSEAVPNHIESITIHLNQLA